MILHLIIVECLNELIQSDAPTHELADFIRTVPRENFHFDIISITNQVKDCPPDLT